MNVLELLRRLTVASAIGVVVVLPCTVFPFWSTTLIGLIALFVTFGLARVSHKTPWPMRNKAMRGKLRRTAPVVLGLLVCVLVRGVVIKMLLQKVDFVTTTVLCGSYALLLGLLVSLLNFDISNLFRNATKISVIFIFAFILVVPFLITVLSLLVTYFVGLPVGLLALCWGIAVGLWLYFTWTQSFSINEYYR